MNSTPQGICESDSETFFKIFPTILLSFQEKEFFENSNAFFSLYAWHLNISSNNNNNSINPHVHVWASPQILQFVSEICGMQRV